MAIELFVIPGFGITGVVGLITLMAGLITSMDELPSGIWWDLDTFTEPMTLFLYSMAMTVIGGIVLVRYLPHSSFGSWLVLSQDLSTAYAAPEVQLTSTSSNHKSPSESAIMRQPNAHLVGLKGVSTTPLRLSGKGRFGSTQILDIVSREDYIEAGEEI